MWKRLSLQVRIMLVLAALILTTLAGGLVTMWHTQATDALFTALVDENFASFQTAGELETNLLRQKGFLTYFYLDGRPEWLEELKWYHLTFSQVLEKARASAYTEAMKAILQEIESQYQSYCEEREKVIGLYKQGDREGGASQHQNLRRRFAEIYQLCERYKLMNEYAIMRGKSESQTQARLLHRIALAAMVGVMGLGTLLAYMLIRQILRPIRQLTLQTGSVEGNILLPDEISALSQRVQTLMANVDQAQSELTRSQEYLIQSEKLALVGKLAAGVAHSIRNPLTSVKMRLFSLSRSLNLDASQAEDFQVIADEIRHIDTIVRHFLEFSRPPKLKMQKVSLSEVVDAAVTLLRQRLEAYGVSILLERRQPLPETWADPEQLKEVLVNLLLNACEAMVGGGRITISEGKGQLPQIGPVAFVKVSDTGPGIPAGLQDKIFQPFFSTKEEGTGLGLSLAARIMKEHGGWLDLLAREGQGATFLLTLPIREEKS